MPKTKRTYKKAAKGKDPRLGYRVGRERLKVNAKDLNKIKSFISEDQNSTFPQKVILIRLLHQVARQRRIRHYSPVEHGNPAKLEPFGIDKKGRIYVRLFVVPGEYEVIEGHPQPRPSKFCINLEEEEVIKEGKVVGTKLVIV